MLDSNVKVFLAPNDDDHFVASKCSESIGVAEWRGWITTLRLSTHRTIPFDKKTDVAQHHQALHHVGLLLNWPPATGGLPFI
jgi:hypothetical protein